MDQHLEVRPYTAWKLLILYWQSKDKVLAYALLVFVLILTLTLVAFDVAYTTWYNYFYNALQEYDLRGALQLLSIFCFIAGVSIVISVYRFYVQQYLALRWRRWLTDEFFNRWLNNKSYYLLETFDKRTDNPDQRLQEDIGSLVTLSLGLLVGLINAVVTIIAFIYVLWQLSGVLVIPLGKYGTWQIPGLLVWVSVGYASLGTWLTYKIGYPLVDLNFEQQRREANFRFAAIDIRSHAEHIALYRGEKHQKGILNKVFSSVLDNWYAIILRQKLLMWFTGSYNQIAVIIPILAAFPAYFSKIFKLGGLMQAMASFRQIQEALSFIVNSYTVIAEWQAVMRRLLTFLNHMYELDAYSFAHKQFIFHSHAQNTIKTKNLNIETPQGNILLKDIDQEFVHGTDYVIKGPSGVGKSTFVRTIAGIWPSGSGEILLPKQHKITFLPQSSYMPIGTLRENLIFPEKNSSVTDDELKNLLDLCDLPQLKTQLYESSNWSEKLSPGELQRISLLRLLLAKPDWAFLDESTSSLDLAHEQAFYALIKEKIPHCSVISIGHRPSLDNYHDVEIDLAKYRPTGDSRL